MHEMSVRLKPLHEQVIVLTGATSGIGLVTARMASKRGARLVLAARNEQALRSTVQELEACGGEAIYVVADVGVEAEVRRVSDKAIAHFGGYDTWINDAAVSIFGRVEEVSIEDQRRLFDTNYWGVVYGSRIACEHLRKRGGKLINIGSVVSERAIPIQSIYSASKAAVLNFTDALRMELMTDGALVSVTLIKPAPIDTPYLQHAANYLNVKPANPPPVYAPDVVAEEILFAAESDIRDSTVGGMGGKMVTVLGNLFPALTDRIMARVMPSLQSTDEPEPVPRKGSLYAPTEDGKERFGYGTTLEHSLYNRAMRNKAITAAAILSAAGVAYGLTRLSRDNTASSSS
jgi:short-subunit dehydrogenase